jgi:hypothetical protein
MRCTTCCHAQQTASTRVRRSSCCKNNSTLAERNNKQRHPTPTCYAVTLCTVRCWLQVRRSSCCGVAREFLYQGGASFINCSWLLPILETNTADVQLLAHTELSTIVTVIRRPACAYCICALASAPLASVAYVQHPALQRPPHHSASLQLLSS